MIQNSLRNILETQNVLSGSLREIHDLTFFKLDVLEIENIFLLDILHAGTSCYSLLKLLVDRLSHLGNIFSSVFVKSKDHLT